MERKFTIGGLELRPLSSTDRIILVVYATAMLFQIMIEFQLPQFRIHGLFLIGFAIGLMTVSTPLGLRFRGVYFSTIWLIVSIIFLTRGTSLSLIPINTFILYHILRFVFWKKYGKEFIPYDAVRGGYLRFVSKIEGRGGYKEDRQFMHLLLWTGVIIVMISIFGMNGLKLE
ncbi:MAG: hypothetical protein JNM78_19590 [Cyclobacteriaceae bacterium]|nr:hypothetical protein [Cyclobacteriaceae bacterium]